MYNISWRSSYRYSAVIFIFIPLGTLVYSIPKSVNIVGAERGIWTLAPVSRPTPLAGEPLHHLGISAWRINNINLNGAADRTWTDTVLLPRDFKSLVSADSTTAAYSVVRWLTLIYYTLIFPACQVFFENFIKLFSAFPSCILFRNSVKY